MARDLGPLRMISGEDVETFVGEGFAYPTKLGADGAVVSASGDNHIAGCTFHNAIYRRGDLPRVHSFGGGGWSAIFGVSSTSTFTKLQGQMKESLMLFEERIENVNPIVFKDLENNIGIRMIYVVKQTSEAKSEEFRIPGVKNG